MAEITYPVKIVQFNNLKKENLDCVEPTVYVIEKEKARFEILIKREKGSSKAVVFGSGTVFMPRDKWPVFYRHSWMNDIACNCLYYFDPTLYLADINLGWCYGTNERWYLREIGEILAVILEKIGVEPKDTLMMGSSGGGFTSIMLATMLHTRCQAINPQIDFRNYWAKLVDSIGEKLLKPGEEWIEERVNAVAFMRAEQYIPHIHIIQNILERHDIYNRIAPFIEDLCKMNAECGYDKIRVDFYHHLEGHNGMPTKEKNLEYIRQDLEAPFFDDFNRNEENNLHCSAEYVLAENSLTVRLSPNPNVSCNWEYAYYLYKDDEIIDKTNYSKETEKTYKVNNPGSYQVKFFIKSGYNKKSSLMDKVSFVTDSREFQQNRFRSLFTKKTTVRPVDTKSIQNNNRNRSDSPLFSDKKLYLVITIDTEDKHENVPNLFECDFDKRGNCGVHYIMSQLEKRNMRGVFFTNIYEHLNYSGEWDGYVENLIKEMTERGHEVGLHTHQDGSMLPFYQEQLFACNYEKQKQIIEYGMAFIEKHTGKKPISHRGGGYRCNDITFRVLSDLGFKVDSSCFAHNTYSPNRNRYYRSLNQICTIDGLLEFPVIAVLDRQSRVKKFDVNQLSLKELKAVVEKMKQRPGFFAGQFMFHSFSFLDQKGSDDREPSFVAGRHAGYGVSPGLTSLFESFLDYLKRDPQIEVVTFEELLLKKIPSPSCWGDGVFDLGIRESDAVSNEFKVYRVNSNYSMDSTYREADIRMQDFNKCAIPDPKPIIGQDDSMEVAAAFINHLLRLNPKMEPIPFPIESFNWDPSNSSLPSEYLLDLHALMPVQCLTTAYSLTEDVTYLKCAFDFINAWKQYVSTRYRETDNPYVWNNMNVASRIENLIYYGKTCSAKGYWSDEIFIPLYDVLQMHGEWLYSNRDMVNQKEQCLRQGQALLHLGVLLQNDSWIERGIERVKKLFVEVCESAQIQNEELTGYCKSEIGLFREISAFLTSNKQAYGSELGEAVRKIENAQQFNQTIAQDNSSPLNVVTRKDNAGQHSVVVFDEAYLNSAVDHVQQVVEGSLLTVEIFLKPEWEGKLTIAWYLTRRGESTPFIREPYGAETIHRFSGLEPGEYQVKYFLNDGVYKHSFKLDPVNLDASEE